LRPISRPGDARELLEIVRLSHGYPPGRSRKAETKYLLTPLLTDSDIEHPNSRIESNE
jgi:hypothetical protein